MKRLAKISGIAYLMIFISGFYANFSILESLVDLNDPAITVTNLINGHSQFGYGLLGFLVMLLFDIVLVWSLFYLTKSVNKNLSYVASLFRLLHAVFFGVALSKLWKAYQITYNAENAMDMEQQIIQLLSGFDFKWTIGLLIFGLHLIVLGFLGLKSVVIPKIIGLLLIVAGAGYLIDCIAKLTFENYDQYQNFFEMAVVLTGVIGELSFTIWLLVKGLKKDEGMKIEKLE